jgi:hypothetical protein
MTRLFVLALTVATSLPVGSTSFAFQQFDRRSCQYTVNTHPSYHSRRLDDNNDDYSLIPETSFGAEAVPEGQRPVNEYLNVQKAPLFGWAKEPSLSLLTRLVVVYSVVFGVVCYPIAGATFTQEGYVVQKVASANVGALFFVILLLLRLYTGWDYVAQRLTSEVIEYEETGWYDGDWERKTQTEVVRDRFLYEDQVKPVVRRLQTFLFGAVTLTAVSVAGLNAANTAKPLFDQYNPDMLEKLRYDDDLADKVKANSVGRPTYCDSRVSVHEDHIQVRTLNFECSLTCVLSLHRLQYYQAVAGGSGCNM